MGLIFLLPWKSLEELYTELWTRPIVLWFYIESVVFLCPSVFFRAIELPLYCGKPEGLNRSWLAVGEPISDITTDLIIYATEPLTGG